MMSTVFRCLLLAFSLLVSASCAARTQPITPLGPDACALAHTAEHIEDGCVVTLRGILFFDRVTWRAPLADATICLTDDDTMPCKFLAATDENGLFALDVPDGQYTLRVCALGFVELVGKVTVSGDCLSRFIELTTRLDT